MPNLYPTGTPQQIQLDEGTQQLIATANSTLNSGQTVTPEVATQAQQGVATANQNIQNTMTPGARQGYLDNTNLGAVQGNYDALAKQLAEYDNIVLKPEFAGQNPGTPSELGGVSGYYNPNLSYNTADAQTPEQVLYNANPKYALSSQVDQGNSIVTLLGTLNKLLGTEAKRGTNKYTSDLSKAAAVLGGLTDILRMNTDLTMKKAELEESRASRANTQGNTTEAKISRISDKLRRAAGRDGYVSPDDWSRIKREAAEEEGIEPKDFDSQFSGRRNPKNRNYRLESSTTGEASDYQKERAYRINQSVDELMEQVDDTTVGLGGQILSNIPNTSAATFASQLDSLKASIAFNELTAMREASKTGGALGQVSNIELQLLESSLGALSTKQSPADFKKQLQKVKDSIARWEKVSTGVTSGGGRPPLSSFDK